MNALNLSRLHYLWLSLFALIADQVTKLIIVQRFAIGDAYVLNPLLSLRLAINRGAAFSFLNNASGWQNAFFIGLAIVICGALIVWLLRLDASDKLSAFGIALVVGGAFGNVVDRLNYGYVIDFIDVHVGVYHWPTFNVADSAVTLGVICLLISSFRQNNDR